MVYTRLFTPFQNARLNLRNRIVVLPYGTSMIRDGKVMDEDIAHFTGIARSGPGLIITGATVVHPSSSMRIRKLVEAYDDDVLEGLKKRSEAIQRYGVKLFGQLVHLGREWIGMDSDYAPSAPSPIRSPRDPYPPHQLDTYEIQTLVDAFGRSAYNLKQAGYDGVEIHGAHGYLVAQFLSPSTNFRSDAYGGTAEKRLRFLVEVIDAIRRYCGEDFGLSVRLSADEELIDGLEIADTTRIAQSLAALGTVDLLNITLGTRGLYVKDMTAADAVAANAASGIRRASGLPVIVGQRISTPEVAERVLAEEAGDLIGMARAFFADPEWINKADAGQAERIRPCLNLNQDCRAFSPHLHCAVNPVTGRETLDEFKQLIPATTAKHIAVVGGGPAGLEAALTAVQRGHRVTVYEAGIGLGGQFMVASAVPHRSGLQRLINFQASELRRLGVTIKLESPVNDLKDLAADTDAVIVATGAVPRPLDESLQQSHVMLWFDVLNEGAPAPYGNGHAVFVDDGSGFWWNYGVAEALVAAGWRVTLVTPSATVAHQIPTESVMPLLGRLAVGQTQFRVLSSLEAVAPGVATVMQVVSGEEEEIACDLVVVQTGRQSVDTLAQRLREQGQADVNKIGDCITPRRVSFAVFEAQRLARTI